MPWGYFYLPQEWSLGISVHDEFGLQSPFLTLSLTAFGIKVTLAFLQTWVFGTGEAALGHRRPGWR